MQKYLKHLSLEDVGVDGQNKILNSEHISVLNSNVSLFENIESSNLRYLTEN